MMIGGPLNYLDDAYRRHGLCFYPRRSSFHVVKDCVACRAPLAVEVGWQTRRDYIIK